MEIDPVHQRAGNFIQVFLNYSCTGRKFNCILRFPGFLSRILVKTFLEPGKLSEWSCEQYKEALAVSQASCFISRS
jgi:hypothetical protein